MAKSIFFYTPLGIDIAGILIAFYFIATDEARFSGSGNSSLVILTALMAGWVILCWYLFKKSKTPVLGTILAWLPAAPLLLYGLMIVLFIILKPDMR